MKTTVIVAIVGLRPQYIKLAAFLEAVREHNAKNRSPISVLTINTGQHYSDELCKTLCDELDLVFNNEIVHTARLPEQILGNSLIRLEQILLKINPKPNWAVVFGDGNPTMIGAIAAARVQIPVIHIEAGVQTEQSEHEEVNRKVADRLATLNFCSTKKAMSTLIQEGKKDSAFWTGDLAHSFTTKVGSTVPSGISNITGDYILMTIHRAHNVNDLVISNLFNAVAQINTRVVFVGHPRNMNLIKNSNIDIPENITLMPPLGYKNMISAIKGSKYVITDSGGLIRESYYFKKRCLVRRKVGGWPELMDAGINFRIGTMTNEILDGIKIINKALESDYPVIEDIINPTGGYSKALNIITNFQ